MFFGGKKKTERTPKETARQLEALEKKVEELSKELAEFKLGMKKAVTKVGVVRFNPFTETGSDQSFVLALLDQDNNGLVVTSHYFKEYNRVYAKPIRAGKSEYSLSKEEEQAIERATKSETDPNGKNSKQKTA